MKNLQTCILLLCFFSFTVYAQKDSIEVVVAKNVEIDSSGIDPKAQQAYNDGTIVFENKNYEKAITDFKKAIEIAADFVQAQNNLAYTYLANKEQNLAEQQFKHIVNINDTLHRPYFELGTMVELKDSLELAIE